MSTKAVSKREEMLSQPIGQQLIKLTLPMLYAIIAITGLGVVDSYFISFLGTAQLAAIAIIVPITAIVSNVALGLGMAISSLNSKLIGADNINGAARLITDGFYLTLIVSLLTSGLLAWQLEPIFKLIGADASTMPYIREYMAIWIITAPLLMLTTVSSSTFRSLGDTSTSAKIAVVMTLANLILDPILIFGFGPIPALGITGAALATLLSVLFSTLIAFYELAIRERFLLWALPAWQGFKRSASDLIEIAIPAVLANTIVPITGAIITRLVTNFGTDAVAGFGVGMRIEAMSLIIVYALSSTLPSFIGQNLGAGKKQRVADSIRIACKFVLVWQLVLYAILALFSSQIAAMFSQNAEVQQVIIHYLWVLPISYGVSGVVILINVSMNVLGKPRLALYINLLRLICFYLPFAYVGSLFGVDGILIGIALANGGAYLLAQWFLKTTLIKQNII